MGGRCPWSRRRWAMSESLEDVEAAGGFPVVYADPPWKYDNGGRGAARGHYACMTAEEIAALPVGRLASRDAVLFLWATGPLLPNAVGVMESWGFRYLTVAFTWVKYHDPSGRACMGGGFWTRSNAEFCLLGVRGEPPRRVDRGVRQLLEESDAVGRLPRRGHSAKPPEFRDRVARLMGDLPRIELFARERVPGWFCWGDDPAIGEPDVLMGVPRVG